MGNELGVFDVKEDVECVVDEIEYDCFGEELK